MNIYRIPVVNASKSLLTLGQNKLERLSQIYHDSLIYARETRACRNGTADSTSHYLLTRKY
jgi:hypothetical protein